MFTISPVSRTAFAAMSFVSWEFNKQFVINEVSQSFVGDLFCLLHAFCIRTRDVTVSSNELEEKRQLNITAAKEKWFQFLSHIIFFLTASSQKRKKKLKKKSFGPLLCQCVALLRR